MNLWVNRIRQLTIMAVALIFLACEDETSLLGFKNPNTKFDLRYIEIPIESKVLLLDSVRTSNYVFGGETNRLLVGQYEDNELGKVTSNGYMQVIGQTSQKLPSDAIYDSVSLQLTLDFYYYGTPAMSSQEIAVYELEDSLDHTKMKLFFNDTEKAVKEPALGTKIFAINPEELEELQEDEKRKTITIRLDDSFGQRLFGSAIRYRNATTKEDSAWFYFDLFLKEFKGLAIKSVNGDKVIGFNLDASQLNIHYQTLNTDSLRLSLGVTIPGFTQQASFSNITVDRSGSPLAGLVPYDTSISSTLDKRYVQAGLGLVTMVNFQNFLNFSDTVKDISIQGATLVIDDVEGSNFPPPNFLALRALRDGNRLKPITFLSDQDKKDVTFYKGYLFGDHTSPSTTPNDSSFYMRHDNVSVFDGNVLMYNEADKKYTGGIGGFLQQLVGDEPGKTKFLNFAIYPNSPAFSKSVNRAVFNKQNIKLRIHYLKPTVNTD